jgi:hypothetical protein
MAPVHGTIALQGVASPAQQAVTTPIQADKHVMSTEARGKSSAGAMLPTAPGVIALSTPGVMMLNTSDFPINSKALMLTLTFNILLNSRVTACVMMLLYSRLKF